MGKKILIVLLTLCLAVVTMTVMAFAETIASGTDWVLEDDGTLSISGVLGMDEWNADYCEDYCTYVKSVVLSNSVYYISDSAFYGCTNLTSISIPNSVSEIECQAFYNCSSLTTVIIPSSVMFIGDLAFSGCSKLQSLVIQGCDTEYSDDIGVDESIITQASHSYVGTVITEATCTEAGVMSYTCSGCGEAYTEEIPAGHNYVDVVTKGANCAEDGVMTSTCSGCGDSYTAVIQATGEHDYAESVTDATCTENMKVGLFCLVCGAEDSDNPAEEIDGTALGHNWTFSDYYYATCTEGSYTLYECTRCDETYKEAGNEPATGHIIEIQNAEEATCTEDGYTGNEFCTVCQNIVSRGSVLPKTGHTAAEAVVENEVEATCTEDGSYESVVYCSVCGEEISRETITVSATGHTAAEAVVENEVEATCTTDGSYDSVVYCTECSAEISRETVTVEAAGHSYELGVCSVCGAKDPDYVTEVTVDAALAETLTSGLVTGVTIRADLGSLTVSEVADDHLLQHIVDVMGFTLNNEAHGDWLLSETESFIIRTTENGRTALKKVTALFYGDIDFASGATITMELSGSEALASGTIYVLHYTNGDWQQESSTSSYADGKLTIEFQPDSASPFLIISVSDYTSSRNNILPLLLQIQSLNQTSTSEESTEEVEEEVVEIDEPVEAGETDSE